MSWRVSTAPDAVRGFAAARAWLLQQGSGPSGRKRWDRLRAARLRLRTHPMSGRAVAGMPDYRQLVISGYRILYRVIPDPGAGQAAGVIRIVAVFGPGQK